MTLFSSPGSPHSAFVLTFQEYYYPSNLLRNIASQNIETEFGFLIDGDFVPNVLAEKKLRQYRWKLQQRQVQFGTDSQTCFIMDIMIQFVIFFIGHSLMIFLISIFISIFFLLENTLLLDNISSQ